MIVLLKKFLAILKNILNKAKAGWLFQVQKTGDNNQLSNNIVANNSSVNVSINNPKESSKKVTYDFVNRYVKEKEEANGYMVHWVNISNVPIKLREGWEYVFDHEDGKKLLDKNGDAVLLKIKK